MKKIISLLLVTVMLMGLLSGCSDPGGDAYVPTGDALLMEGEDPEDLSLQDEELQALTLTYYPNRSMNPLIGVNMGTLGYLCELEEATVFDALDQLFQDNYTTEERIMLSAAKVGGGEDARLALNDIVIHWTEFMSLLRLYVYVNGKPLNTYEADGILVATPTGSTGYNISAGGPIVEPKARMLLLTPINAHDLNARSIVLGDEDVIEIEIGTRRYQADEKACVSFDGDTVMQLQVGDKVRITRASNSIRICKLNNQSFLEILRKKMQR